MTEHRGNYLMWDGSMRVRLDAEPHRQVISLHWNMGKRLEAVPTIKAVVNTKDLPDHMVIGRINYVSDRLKGLLDSAGVTAQYFPVVELRTRRGQAIESPPFFAMNPLVRTACFDFEHSEFEREPENLGGGIERIRRLSILESRLEGAPVAVFDELGGAFMLMRRDVVKRLREAGIHGCRWREIEDVRLPQTDWPAES